MFSRQFVTSLSENLLNLKFTAFGCRAPLRFKADVSKLTSACLQQGCEKAGSKKAVVKVAVLPLLAAPGMENIPYNLTSFCPRRGQCDIQRLGRPRNSHSVGGKISKSGRRNA